MRSIGAESRLPVFSSVREMTTAAYARRESRPHNPQLRLNFERVIVGDVGPVAFALFREFESKVGAAYAEAVARL